MCNFQLHEPSAATMQSGAHINKPRSTCGNLNSRKLLISAKACVTSPEVLLCIETCFLGLVLFISAAAYLLHGRAAYTAILVVE